MITFQSTKWKGLQPSESEPQKNLDVWTYGSIFCDPSVGEIVMAWECWKSVKSPARFSFFVRLDGVKKYPCRWFLLVCHVKWNIRISFLLNTTNKGRSSTLFYFSSPEGHHFGRCFFVIRASTGSFDKKPWESWRTNATFLLRYFAERNRTVSLVVQFHHGCLCHHDYEGPRSDSEWLDTNIRKVH